jgi:hypothetical protein
VEKSHQKQNPITNCDEGNAENIGKNSYWFYIDFNKESAAFESGWINARSDSVVQGLLAALNGAEIPCSITRRGWIRSIGGVSNDAVGIYTEDCTEWYGNNWMNWFWTSIDTSLASVGSWVETPGLDVSVGWVFYVGFTMAHFNLHTFEKWSDLNPNRAVSGWKSAGPFV